MCQIRATRETTEDLGRLLRISQCSEMTVRTCLDRRMNFPDCTHLHEMRFSSSFPSRPRWTRLQIVSGSGSTTNPPGVECFTPRVRLQFLSSFELLLDLLRPIFNVWIKAVFSMFLITDTVLSGFRLSDLRMLIYFENLDFPRRES